MKLTARQIERLVKQGEVVHTECKDASGGFPDSLWESYSSFANTDGGVILLGVKEVDHRFSIAGVPKAATLIKRFWDGVYTDSDQDPTNQPKVPQECPRSAQNRSDPAPKLAQGAPRCPKSAPRVPQEIGDAPSSVKQVYLAMHEDVAITHRGLESKLGLSKTTIRKATATLIQRGLVRRVGPRFGGHWEVVK